MSRNHKETQISLHYKMDLVNSPIPMDVNQLYLNGSYTSPHSTEYYSVFNPKDNSLVADRVSIADDIDVDNAVTFAEAAFRGPWGGFSAADRSGCFYRLVDLLEKQLTDILYLDSLTTGNPVSLIPTRERNYICNCLLYYGKTIVQ